MKKYRVIYYDRQARVLVSDSRYFYASYGAAKIAAKRIARQRATYCYVEQKISEFPDVQWKEVKT
jgi:hypothetical protein